MAFCIVRVGQSLVWGGTTVRLEFWARLLGRHAILVAPSGLVNPRPNGIDTLSKNALPLPYYFRLGKSRPFFGHFLAPRWGSGRVVPHSHVSIREGEAGGPRYKTPPNRGRGGPPEFWGGGGTRGWS